MGNHCLTCKASDRYYQLLVAAPGVGRTRARGTLLTTSLFCFMYISKLMLKHILMCNEGGKQDRTA